MTKILFEVAFGENKDYCRFERNHNLYRPTPKDKNTNTLERIFKENVGIPPKEFRVIRFREVLKCLSNRSKQHPAETEPQKSLLQMAFELGYYDHAHLTNEFKKYAGVLPSELSPSYETPIAGDEYF